MPIHDVIEGVNEAIEDAGVNILPQILKLFSDNSENFQVFPYKTSLICNPFCRNFSLMIISLNGKIFSPVIS